MLDYIKENYLLIGKIFILILVIIGVIQNLYLNQKNVKYQTFSLDKESQIKDYTNNFQNIYSKDFDMTSLLEWTYYYIDSNMDTFTKIESELKNKGYNDFHVLNNNEDEPLFFGFKKIEIHTPESLVKRNIELEKLGNEYGIQYDGFEFGKIRE